MISNLEGKYAGSEVFGPCMLAFLGSKTFIRRQESCTPKFKSFHDEIFGFHTLKPVLAGEIESGNFFEDIMKHKTEAIWTEFNAQLKQFILSRVSDKSVADDILQKVFIKIHSHVGTLREDRKIERWIYQITRNTIIDHYRTQKMGADIPEDIPVSDEIPEKIDIKTGLTSIKAMIEALPQPYAQALLLTEFEGLTQKEVAQKLGISISGAKSRVQRARKMLKNKLNECCRIEFDRHKTIVDYQCTYEFLSQFKKDS